MTTLRATAPAAVALAALILLSGCTPPGSDPAPTPSAADPSPTPTAAATPEPDPVAAAMPDLSGTEVVLVTTTVTAPNGAALSLAMTTYYPVTVASSEGQAILAFLSENGDASDVSNPAFLADRGAVLQLSTITAVDASPGTAWPAGVGATPQLGPNLTDTLIGLNLTRDSNGWPQIAGAASGYGVAALYRIPETSTELPLTEWANFWTFYGFDNRAFGFDVSSCEIVTTALAQESAAVFTWADVPYTCEVGIGH